MHLSVALGIRLSHICLFSVLQEIRRKPAHMIFSEATDIIIAHNANFVKMFFKNI